MKGHFGNGGPTPEAITYREKVNAAMVTAGGDRKLAASILGISEKKLSIKLNTCEELRARWGVVDIKPLNPAELLNRDIVTNRNPHLQDQEIDTNPVPSLDEPLTNEDMAIASAQRSEDEKVLQGLQKMGMSDPELQIAISLQQWGDKFWPQSVHLIGGGMTRTSVQIQHQLDRIKDRVEKLRSKLETVDEGNIELRKLLIEEEKNQLKAFNDFGRLATAMADVAYKGVMIKATIERNQNPRKTANKKPGFGRMVDV